MSVGHLDHALLTVYSSMESTINSQQGMIKMSDRHRNVVIR